MTGTTSTLTLQVGGGGTGTAAFLSSSGDTATCRDTVQAVDTDGAGIAVQPDPITLTGSTIRNTRATDATPTFAGDQPGSGFSVVANSLTVGTGSAIADAFGNPIDPNNPAGAEPGIVHTP